VKFRVAEQQHQEMGVGSQDAIKQFQAFIEQGLSLFLSLSVLLIFSLFTVFSHFFFVSCFEFPTMVVEEPLRGTFQVSIFVDLITSRLKHVSISLLHFTALICVNSLLFFYYLVRVCEGR